MSEINWGRFSAAALVAGLVAFMLDGLMHSFLLKPMWMELAKAYGQPTDGPMNPGDFVYYVLYDLAKGAGAVWIYVLARKPLGPGVRTALVAGVTVWALTIPIPLGGELPFHWFGRRVAFFWALYGLPLTALYAIAGAAVYRGKA